MEALLFLKLVSWQHTTLYSLEMPADLLRVLPLRYTLEEGTLLVQKSSPDCGKEEVAGLGAVKCWEPDVCLGREFSMCAT